MNNWLEHYKVGGFSKTGYRKNSKDKFNDFNIIESPYISMDNVTSPIMAYPDNGSPTILYPNQNYYFPGATVVREFPLGKMQPGGKVDKRMLPKQQQEVRTTNYIPPMEQFRTSSNAVTTGAPWENKPMYINPYAGQQEVVRTAEPQRSALSKAGQVARHPMTAASYMMKGQSVPDYLEYGEKNAYDNAVGIINPLTYYDAGKRVVTAEHFRNPNTSVGEAIGLTALDAAMVYGIGKGVYNKYSPKQHVRIPVEEGSGNVGMVNREGQFTTLVNEPRGRVTNSPEMEARIKELHANWQKASQSTAETDRLNEMLERYGVKGDIPHQEALYPMQSFEYQSVNNSSRVIPGVAQPPHIQEQHYQQEQSGVPFHLNNSVPQQVSQKQSKKTIKQQPKIQHIGSGNFTVMEDANGQQNMYHFNTREEADAMVNKRQYKQGGKIEYTGTNRPADKVHYTPQQAPVYSVGEQYMMEHPQQYMRSAEGYGTPQQQRDHEYLRNKMYQQEAEERANREFANNPRWQGANNLAEEMLVASDILGYGAIGKMGAKKLIKSLAKKPKVFGESNVLPHDPFSSVEVFPTTPTKPSGNFPASYVRKNPTGKTGAPTITEFPELNKEQKILESFGINPRNISNEPITWYPTVGDKGIETNLPPEIQKKLGMGDDILKKLGNLKNPYKKTPDNRMIMVPGPFKKGEIFEQGYNLRSGETYHLWNREHAPWTDAGIDRSPEFLKYDFPESYTDFGPKTPMQRMINEERRRKDQIPDELLPKVRQQNKYGGKVNGWLFKY